MGTSEGDDSEITSGLAAGDIVVMTGIDKLQEGSKVTAQIAPATNGVKTPPVATPVNPAISNKGHQPGR
jgi:multidrug efflux system membrane fusion protein